MSKLASTLTRLVARPLQDHRAFLGARAALRGVHPGSLAVLCATGLGLVVVTNIAGEDPASASFPRLSGKGSAQAAQVNAAALVQNAKPADEAIPARPFLFSALDQVSKERAETCLAEAVYYEAGSESEEGQRAVAQVVLNRVRHSAFPSSVCGVVYQGAMRQTGCQFTFTCDGSLARRPTASGWQRALGVARQALAGSVYAPVGFATHYHATWMLPYWAPSVALVGRVGGHVFYTWKGLAGSAAAFTQAYAGVEAPTATRMAEVGELPVLEAAAGLDNPVTMPSERSEDELLADPDNADLLGFRRAGEERPATRADEAHVVSSIQSALE